MQIKTLKQISQGGFSRMGFFNKNNRNAKKHGNIKAEAYDQEVERLNQEEASIEEPIAEEESIEERSAADVKVEEVQAEEMCDETISDETIEANLKNSSDDIDSIQKEVELLEGFIKAEAFLEDTIDEKSTEEDLLKEPIEAQIIDAESILLKKKEKGFKNRAKAFLISQRVLLNPKKWLKALRTSKTMTHKNNNRSLLKKNVITSSAIILLLIAAISTISYLGNRAAITDEIIRQLEAELEANKAKVETLQQRILDGAILLSNLNMLKSETKLTEAEKILKAFSDSYSGIIEDVFITDSEGIITVDCVEGTLVGSSIATRDYFKKNEKGNPAFSDLQTSRITGKDI